MPVGLARNSSNMLSRSVKNRHLCYQPLGEKYLAFHHYIKYCIYFVGLFLDAPYQVEEVPLYSFWEIFMMNVWNFFIFCQILKLCDLLYGCFYSTLHWFLNIEPILHAWNESNLVMVYNSFYALLNSVW